MKKNFSLEDFLRVASEMYEEDGTIYSERYSSQAWEKRGWPEVDSDLVYKILDSHISFLRRFDEYNGKENKLWKRKDILGRIKKD